MWACVVLYLLWFPYVPETCSRQCLAHSTLLCLGHVSVAYGNQEMDPSGTFSGDKIWWLINKIVCFLHCVLEFLRGIWYRALDA